MGFSHSHLYNHPRKVVHVGVHPKKLEHVCHDHNQHLHGCSDEPREVLTEKSVPTEVMYVFIVCSRLDKQISKRWVAMGVERSGFIE